MKFEVISGGGPAPKRKRTEAQEQALLDHFVETLTNALDDYLVNKMPKDQLDATLDAFERLDEHFFDDMNVSIPHASP
jgi:hypothetical protein